MLEKNIGGYSCPFVAPNTSSQPDVKQKNMKIGEKSEIKLTE
jgi:hypothetical protein